MNNYKNLLIDILRIMPIFGLIFIKNYDKKLDDLLSITYNSLGGSFFMSNLMYQPVQDLLQSLKIFLPSFIIKDKKYIKLLNFNKKLKDIDEQNKKSIIDGINLFQIEIEGGRNDRLTCIENYINFMFEINKKIEKKNYSLNEINDKIINIEQLISNFSNKDQLKSQLIKPILVKFFMNDNTFDSSKIKINPLYLLGNPGVGKTYFVNELSKILDIPIFNYYYKERMFQNDNILYFEEKNISCLSKALHSIKKQNKNEFILFIDEFDKFINKQNIINILKIINTDNDEFYDEYLKTNFSLNIIIILSGNINITNIPNKFNHLTLKDIKPLNDRLLTINFPDKTYEEKKEIILNKIQSYNLQENDITNICDFIKNEKSGSLRNILKFVNEYNNTLLCDNLLKDTIINHKTIMSDIYKKYEINDEITEKPEEMINYNDIINQLQIFNP